jgi:hypothetical protein
MQTRSLLVGNATFRSLLTKPSPRSGCRPALALAASLTASCGGDASTGPTAADRATFVGTWAGHYSCVGGAPAPDTLVIRLGPGALDFSIIIHVQTVNPDTVAGALTTPTVVHVPEQPMGGAPGTARITSTASLLAYSQTGFGITCGGTDYARVP